MRSAGDGGGELRRLVERLRSIGEIEESALFLDSSLEDSGRCGEKEDVTKCQFT